jgi:hypothetical protein
MPEETDQAISQYFNLDAADLVAIKDAIGSGRSLGDLLTSVAALEANAYVPGTDRLSVESNYAGTQTFTNGVAGAITTLTFDTPYFDVGDSFELGTKGIRILEGSFFSGEIFVDVPDPLVSNRLLSLQIFQSATDGGVAIGSSLVFITYPLIAVTGFGIYAVIPFSLMGVTPGNWIYLKGAVRGGDLTVDSFGGMDIRRIA